MNNNLQFINGADLNNEQITEVTKLLFETGYYQEAALNNKLNLPPLEFHKQATVMPALPYVRALIDMYGQIIAFHLCLTQQETAKLYNNRPNYYTHTKDSKEVLSAIKKLYTENSNPTDLIHHNSCIRKEMRGKGLLKILFQDQLAIAKNKSCNRIFWCTWESKANSLAIFTHYGAKIIGVLDFTHTALYKDRLMNLAVDTSELDTILASRG